jgi:gamma-glutamyltranspeptidase / glutathione hydrolase
MYGTRSTASVRLLLVLVLVWGTPSWAPAQSAAPVPETAAVQGGMVAATVGPAVAAGQEILRRGGNAVDAAVATGFAVGCAHQFSSGIGGGGLFVIWQDGKAYTLDARETAPAKATRDMYLGPDGKADPKKSRDGGLSIAVPGMVQGYHEAHARFGKLKWAEVIAPAVSLCRTGVALSAYHRRVLKALQEKILKYPETARIQLDLGELPPEGWTLVQNDLALTYELIAENGPGVMTSGAIGESIVNSAAAYGGVLTLEDLKAYKPVWREPVVGTYRGHQIVSMPPPSSGGILLVEMLNALEPFDLRGMGRDSSQTVHLVAETMKLAFADRAEHLGDPDFYKVPQAWLTSKKYGAELSAKLRPRPFFLKAPWRWGTPDILKVERAATPPPEDHGTTHISVLDGQGNAVALTQTVNTPFGSGITAAGTGIVLNNEMDDFAAAPNTPNAFQLLGGEANSVQPGKRPLSSMSPSVVLENGKPWLVTGGQGGSLIISATLHTILNVVDFGMDAQQAVTAPRYHHQWRPDQIVVENALQADTVKQLEAWGHPIRRTDGGLATTATIVRDPKSGELKGGRDPRRD